MVELIVTLTEFAEDAATNRIWSIIQEQLLQNEGICFYKHPVLMSMTGVAPELTLITKNHHPIVIRCLSVQLEDIDEITDESWYINGNEIDSPILEAEDFIIALNSKFEKDRILRNRLKPVSVIAMPLIARTEFYQKFSDVFKGLPSVWADGDVSSILRLLTKPLSEDEWRHVRSIIQGINPLTRASGFIPETANSLGEAIKYIDRHIALLDEDQMKAALQIAPGPQRIRGLAGTGKTVLLAMKAAMIHLRYRERRILFTFNTQSLYNQIRLLITKFYRFYSDEDPDWDYLKVLHAWGGFTQPGVYYETCIKGGCTPLTFPQARWIKKDNPIQVCYQQLLTKSIEPEYDFIMIDEAQDFPPEVFQVLYKLSKEPHQIYWVYDDLQSLMAIQIPSPEELFGKDNNGVPFVSLSGDLYPGGIEKDIILHKSYRCPQEVLMLAHAIGLGVYREGGCIQMLSTPGSWEALGYIIEEGNLVEGENTIIYRPPENSPNPITKIYQREPVVNAKVFPNRTEELEWIANSINNDIKVENVRPEHIVVICLNAPNARKLLPPLQKRLAELDIPSTIPGISHPSASFAEPGRVTLSSVFRAKGNESYIVYIFSFEALFDYVEELQNRNQAFTAISRSKGWVRISGIGNGMEKAKEEIDNILYYQPRFVFTFPNMDSIRNLDAETDRRRREIKRGRDSVNKLVDLDKTALEALAQQEPDLIEKLQKILNEAKKP